MLASVRARLTLWHTAVVAVLVGLFAAAAYGFVVYSSRARTDAELTDAVTDLEDEILTERRTGPNTRAAATEVVRELRFRTIAFVVYDATGRIVAASIPRPRRPDPGEPPEPPLDLRRLWAAARSETVAGTRLVSVGDPEGGYRAAISIIRAPDGGYTLAAAQSLHEEAETLSDAQLAMAVAIPLTLVLAALGGWLLARRSLAPMVAMREHAAAIGSTNLGERLAVANPDDEVGRLAAVINDLLARLDRAFAQQRQFMADASHELRTPLTVVQNEAAVALSRTGRSSAEHEDALVVIRAAARRLRRIVDDLFLLARADAGEVPVRRDPLYVDEVAADCVREVRSLAQARGVALSDGGLPEAPFVGDEALLHRLVLNLLDNAIKYSPAGATVTVRLSRDDRRYRLEVEDTGPGVPPAIKPHIFDRFVRADVARGHDDGDELTSGAGLGLSIARWIAEAHGGTLALERSSPGGSLFVLMLPNEGPGAVV